MTIRFRTGEELIFSATRRRIHFSRVPPTRLFVRAYGSTRLLPRRNLKRPPVGRTPARQVTNLFHPNRPVLNINDWHRAAPRPPVRQRGAVAERPAEHSGVRTVEGGCRTSAGADARSAARPRRPQRRLRIGALDGRRRHRRRGRPVHDLRHAAGIVLLDEIDAHLHPRWKMRIVESLRATFSRHAVPGDDPRAAVPARRGRQGVRGAAPRRRRRPLPHRPAVARRPAHRSAPRPRSCSACTPRSTRRWTPSSTPTTACWRRARR